MAGLRARELAILGLALAAGLAGTATAIGGRDGDSAFVYRQENPSALPTTEVERIILTAPDPLTGRGRGTASTCRPGASGALRNPWSCRVRYPSGRRVRLSVRIRDDGSYVARYAGGGRAVGCCVRLPRGG
jgi:hypothetical protein